MGVHADAGVRARQNGMTPLDLAESRGNDDDKGLAERKVAVAALLREVSARD